jgi:flavin-dependent dehydrogenase
MALLGRHGLGQAVESRGLPVEGMLVTGPGGISVSGVYPRGCRGRSLTRSDLDVLLLAAAERAGASVDLGVRVTAPMLEHDGGEPRIVGVTIAARSGRRIDQRAPIVLAADGRRSTLALSLGLVRQPRRPRRWALGAYYEGVGGLTNRGEMHVRSGHYLGVAPVPGGLANVCLVVPEVRARIAVRAPAIAIEAALMSDGALRERFRRTRRATDVRVLGPLAMDSAAAGMRGLLLAGDAAGFIDPMTGDGMRLAMRGAELAAGAALRGLAGEARVHEMLALDRAREFRTKLRVNRRLRGLVAQPAAIAVAAAIAAIAPAVLERLIAYSGDVGVTSSDPLVAAGAAI